MKTTILSVLGLLVCGSIASADDLVLAPSPAVVQRTTYYAPATVVAPQPVTSYYSAPGAVTSYYAPAPTTVVGPTVVGPTPVTSYYAPAPVVVARPTVTYYAPAAVPVTTYYAPAPVPVTTYYAPTTTYYAPAVVAAPVGVVRSKVYYPGMPVRNFFKAITP
jgi:hypothetical protein